jgi:multisubunit Na+/H+ antiporter MnhC subunit
MGTKFFYALAWTLCTAIFMLLLYFTGYQTEKLATGQHLNWLGLLIPIVLLYLGIKAVRDEKPAVAFTYGQGVGAGMVISVFAGLMGAVYSWFHFTFINTRFMDYTMDMIREKWSAAGMSAAQMDRAEGITRTMMSPIPQALIGLLFTLIIGLCISLIMAAILKRDKPLPAAATPPPTPPPA